MKKRTLELGEISLYIKLKIIENMKGATLRVEWKFAFFLFTGLKPKSQNT